MQRNTPTVAALPDMPTRIVRVAIRSTPNLFHAQAECLKRGILVDLVDLHQFKKTFKDEPI